jgi:hypothetical protein
VGRKQIECAKALFLSLLNVYTLDKILKNEMDKEVVYPKKHEAKDGQTPDVDWEVIDSENVELKHGWRCMPEEHYEIAQETKK